MLYYRLHASQSDSEINHPSTPASDRSEIEAEKRVRKAQRRFNHPIAVSLDKNALRYASDYFTCFIFYRFASDTRLLQKEGDIRIPSSYLYFHRLNSAERHCLAVDDIFERSIAMKHLQKKSAARATLRSSVSQKISRPNC
jgi:hypothetical protein